MSLLLAQFRLGREIALLVINAPQSFELQPASLSGTKVLSKFRNQRASSA